MLTNSSWYIVLSTTVGICLPDTEVTVVTNISWFVLCIYLPDIEITAMANISWFALCIYLLDSEITAVTNSSWYLSTWHSLLYVSIYLTLR